MTGDTPFPSDMLKVAADDRITPNLRVCLTCESVLWVLSGTDSNVIALFGHCPQCRKVYYLDGVVVR